MEMDNDIRLLGDADVRTFGIGKNTDVVLVALALACFGVSAWFLAPGWLTTDSLSHYMDARNGVYRDMYPVLLSWIWNKLLVFGDGPLPMLVLNLASYWAGFYFLSEAARVYVGKASIIVLLCGFWPGIIEQVGFIWKDILFGTMMLFAWAVLIAAHYQKRKLRGWEKFALVGSTIISVGVKINGITAIPFVFYAWFYVENRLQRSFLKMSMASMLATCAVAGSAFAITLPSQIVRQGNLVWQYTQIYDLLAMSSASGKVLLPKHVTDMRTDDINELRKYYWPGGMNSFFFHKGGTLATVDPVQVRDLSDRWIAALKTYPLDYLYHRWDNLAVMLRLGAYTPAWVGEPAIWENPFIPPLEENVVSKALGASIKTMPWAYLPWIYILLAAVALIVSLCLAKSRIVSLLIFASSAAFLFPHLFVLPAADYRYLYFCYLMALAAGIVALIDVCAYIKGNKSPLG